VPPLLALLLAVPLAGRADGDDQQRIRTWVEEGRILPLAELLERLPPGLEGRLLEVELEEERGRPVYEIEWLRQDGRVIKFEFDARDGTLLSRERERGRKRD
jgi:uncharacterized membrane protein YkoI